MRISDAQLYDLTRRSLSRAKQDLSVAQEQASTGVRVAKPSDDPTAAAAARRERNTQRLAESGQRGAELATVYLEGADEAIGEMQDLLSRAKELAMVGSTDTMDVDSMRAQQTEVLELKRQLVLAGNTKVAGSYIFGGFKDDVPPFDAQGVYTGDDTPRTIEVLPGVRVASSTQISSAVGVGGGVDVFQALDSLAAALGAGDRDAVRATLSDLTTSEKQLIDARTQVGSTMDGIAVARSVSERYKTQAQIERGRLVDADEISAISDLMQAKSALDAAIASASKLPIGGLINGGG